MSVQGGLDSHSQVFLSYAYMHMCHKRERKNDIFVCVCIHVYVCEYRGQEERGKCRDKERAGKQKMNEYVCL